MHLVHLPAGRGMSHTLRESMLTRSSDWMYMYTLCMYIHVSLNHYLLQGNGSITVVGSWFLQFYTRWCEDLRSTATIHVIQWCLPSRAKGFLP